MRKTIWACDLLQFIDNESLRNWLGWDKEVVEIKVKGKAIVESE